MNSQEYLNQEIKKRAIELEITFPEIGINSLVGLLNEGAKIQSFINNIEQIEELFDHSSFESALEHYSSMVEYNKKYPPGSVRPPTPAQLIIKELENEGCRFCGQKVFVNGKRHDCYKIEDK